MRMKPLLAVAALAVAIAGCTAAPQTLVSSVTQTTPSGLPPRVQLDVQGLAQAEVTASTLTLDPKPLFRMDAGTFAKLLSYVVTKNTPLPEGAQDLKWLYNFGGVYYNVVTNESWASHRLYRLAMQPEAMLDLLSASFLSDNEPSVTGTLEILADGSLAVTHPQNEAFDGWESNSPLLKLTSDAPAALRLVAAPNYTWMAVTETKEFTRATRRHHLEVALILTSNSGKPLLGLTMDALDLHDVSYALAGSKSTQGVDPENRFVTLKELGEGRYTLGIDLFTDADDVDLQAVTIDLSLRNAPQFRDVEY